MNLFAFVLKRASRHWQVLVTLSIGVMLATALLSSGPILVNTVVEFGLRRNLVAGDILQGNVRLEAFTFIPGDDPDTNYAETDAAVRTLVAETIGPYVEDIVPAQSSFRLLPWVDQELLPADRVSLRAQSGLEPHITFVSGGWPEDAVVDRNGRVVSAVISSAMADAYGLEPGDRLPLSETSGEDEPVAWLEVSGVARPLDPTSRYWFGTYSPFAVTSDSSWDAEYGVIVAQADFFAAADTLLPRGRPELDWNIFIDPATIGADDWAAFLTQLDVLRSRLDSVSAKPNLQTRIDDVVSSYGAQAGAVRAPLLLLTAEIVLLALYYVVMVAALSVQQVERELAILASRGMTRLQLFSIQLLEAGLIAIVAVVSGPVIGAALVRGLAVLGPLADVGQAAWPLTVTSAAWLAALVGGLASVLGLLVPSATGVRRSIVSYQHRLGRSGKKPVWQRYYLDVFVLATGLVLLWRVQVYGGIVGGSVAQTQVDWLLLLAPLALMLGAGTILLRVFPLILRLLARLAALGRGVAPALAMWHVSRNPAHVTRLVLLLTLAMALGVLSTGLNATLDLSEEERARYAAGSDLRLTSARAIAYTEVDRVLASNERYTPQWRGEGSISQGRAYESLDLLAISPADFASMATFRDDFAAIPMETLLQRLRVRDASRQPVTPLPGQPDRLGVWIWAASDAESPGGRRFVLGDSDLDRIALSAKVQSRHGQFTTIPLLPQSAERYPADGWRYFEGSLAELPESNFPLSLHSLWFQNRTRADSPNFVQYLDWHMQLGVDDITVADRATGEQTVVDSFEELVRIWELSGTEGATAFEPEGAHTGRARLLLNHSFAGREWVGLSLVNIQKTEALPALASQDFMELTGAEVGDVFPVSVRFGPTLILTIVGSVNYFPTMLTGKEAGYLVTNLESLIEQLNRETYRALNANEVLIESTERPPEELVLAASQVPDLAALTSADDLRRTMKADPMALGLRSVTFFGYVLTGALSLIGFATYFFLSARQRESSYGVLRSIGMAPRQLYGMLALEQLTLIIFGLLLGSILGVVLNQMTLPGLPINLGDQPPIPPFRAQNDWGAVLRVYLLLGTAFVLALGSATWLLWRRRLHRVLRIGEE